MIDDVLDRNHYTERARLAILFARRAARERDATHTTALHVLLGLLREEEGRAAELLERHGITVEGVLARLPPTKRPDPGSEHGSPPFDDDAVRVLERAVHEARWAEREYAATEHLLLGLVHEAGGEVRRLLLLAGVGEEGVREELANRR